MSLLERAKQTAQAADEQKEKEVAAKKRLMDECNAARDKLLQDVVVGLKEFDNVECNAGVLKLIIGEEIAGTPYDAILSLDRSKRSMSNVHVLYVTARVESGTADYSDDCRGVPYTEAVVRAYNGKEQKRHVNKHYMRSNDDRAGLCSFTDSVSGVGNVDRLLVRIADYLAPLFSKK